MFKDLRFLHFMDMEMTERTLKQKRGDRTLQKWKRRYREKKKKGIDSGQSLFLSLDHPQLLRDRDDVAESYLFCYD